VLTSRLYDIFMAMKRRRKLDKEQQKRGKKGGRALYNKVGSEGMRALVMKRWHPEKA